MYEVGDLVEVRCNNDKDVMSGIIVEKSETRKQVYKVVVFDNGVFSEPYWINSLDFVRKIA